MPGAHKKRQAAGREVRRNQGGSTAGNQGGSTAGNQGDSTAGNQDDSTAGSVGAQPEPYDGPASNAGEARGRPGSATGTRSSSRPGSQVRGSSQTGQAVDPAKKPEPKVLLRNVDFGGNAYNIFNQVSQKFARLPQCHSALLITIFSVFVCRNCQAALLPHMSFHVKIIAGWLHYTLHTPSQP